MAFPQKQQFVFKHFTTVFLSVLPTHFMHRLFTWSLVVRCLQNHPHFLTRSSYIPVTYVVKYRRKVFVWGEMYSYIFTSGKTYLVIQTWRIVKWATTWQNQQSDCAPSEDSDQPGHPPSLISLRCWTDTTATHKVQCITIYDIPKPNIYRILSKDWCISTVIWHCWTGKTASHKVQCITIYDIPKPNIYRILSKNNQVIYTLDTIYHDTSSRASLDILFSSNSFRDTLLTNAITPELSDGNWSKVI